MPYIYFKDIILQFFVILKTIFRGKNCNGDVKRMKQVDGMGEGGRLHEEVMSEQRPEWGRGGGGGRWEWGEACGES